MFSRAESMFSFAEMTFSGPLPIPNSAIPN
jgi:hypothetical protein